MDVVVLSGATVPAGIAVRNYNGLSRADRCLLAYLCFTTLANVVAQRLAARSINNMPLLHLDTLVETTLFILFFRLLFSGKRWVRMAQLALVAFPVLCIVNLAFQSIYQFNTYTRSLEALVLIAFSGAYWLSVPEGEIPARRWMQVGTNWTVSGIQLYFTSTIFLFIYSNFLVARSDAGTNTALWNLHGAITLAMYLLFAKGFSLCKP